MTNNELNKYTAVLEAMQIELIQVVRNRDGILIEKSPDAFDEIQHATERELAISNLARESGLLRNVGEALRRIDEGAFGVCLRCQEDISPKRLSAIPWTRFCIECQEIADSRPAGDAGDPAERLVNAA
jgi:DnaK suppressor protein